MFARGSEFIRRRKNRLETKKKPIRDEEKTDMHESDLTISLDLV